jgi:SAM-dependent methyltransferase
VSAAPDRDPWAEWLRGRRHGDDEETLERTLESLAPVRDRVLANAGVAEGETLLDVGCGHGLIAFGAVELVGASGRVIFSDVSPGLLADCRRRAEELGVLDRCRFVEAPAGELAEIDDASVDAVTARSVLIYLNDVLGALREFRRVLRPGGRLSIFEPINRFSFPEPADRLWGYDVAAVRDLADRLKAVYERSQPTATSTLMGFDERDLVAGPRRPASPMSPSATRWTSSAADRRCSRPASGRPSPARRGTRSSRPSARRSTPRSARPRRASWSSM